MCQTGDTLKPRRKTTTNQRGRTALSFFGFRSEALTPAVILPKKTPAILLACKDGPGINQGRKVVNQ